ncbi:hypothetical protein FOZ60_007954 [Perkinsus olseni]|uniref:Uncharacterized protein n=1 Tax=Perkinsus olseni TaxID=32597 RepID=A0A7J6NKK8_PEROL|nr:hypothetical protein FOZ60_007954 [Perkinsus olseni]
MTPITLDICPDRAKRLTKTIDDHLQSASITPTQASKLAGRLSFAATSFHSRCGRAFLRALYHRANDTNYGHHGNNNDEALAALRWFRWAITACPSKIVYLHTNTPHVILYTDAEFSYTGDPPTAKSGGIGAVLAIPNHQRVLCLSWPLPADVFDFLEQRQTDIHPLEVMAIPIALHHWLTTMVPLQLSCSSFYFGEPAASTSPSTRTPRDINNLVAATWKLCAENNTPHDISRHLEAKRILRHLRSVESSTFKTYLQGARHYARFCGALGRGIHYATVKSIVKRADHTWEAATKAPCDNDTLLDAFRTARFAVVCLAAYSCALRVRSELLILNDSAISFDKEGGFTIHLKRRKNIPEPMLGAGSTH